MGPIRLVIADVDATLLRQGALVTARTQEAAERLREAGVALALVGAQPPMGLARLARALELSTPIAAFDGGMLVTPELTVLEQQTLSLAVAQEVLDCFDAAGVEVWLYRGLHWLVRKANTPEVKRERRTEDEQPTVVDDLHALTECAVQIVGVSDDAARLAHCEAELRERVGALVMVTRPRAHRLEVCDPDATKATAVRSLSRILKLPLDQIAAVGADPTDVLMFALAGTSIAMGDASLEVQRAARHVTTTKAEEGFAHAVDAFVLPHPRNAQEMLGLPAGTRACLFDLDGVLTQTAKLHAAAWKQTFDDYLRERAERSGEPFVPFDEATDYARHVDGKLRLDGARSFLASRGIVPPQAEVEALAQRKDALMVERLHREHVEVYDGSVRFLRAARDAGLRTAVVSASKHCKDVLESSGLLDLFDVRVDGVVAARDHLAGKPAPDTFLAAAHAVGVEPVHAAVFEDALAGVAAGRAGHFGYVVGVDRLGQAAELRRHGADVVVSDLSALMEAR
jgi:beta-phosphoglucomutase family hydrolase/Cof subfamily protein (haloacid dehalogenase superfamily)